MKALDTAPASFNVQRQVQWDIWNYSCTQSTEGKNVHVHYVHVLICRLKTVRPNECHEMHCQSILLEEATMISEKFVAISSFFQKSRSTYMDDKKIVTHIEMDELSKRKLIAKFQTLAMSLFSNNAKQSCI